MSTRRVATGRPDRTGRSAKAAQTRARILESARLLFNERGTAAVSTNHIAARTGLSPGNLYYHFADKQEIVRTLHDQYASAYEGRWQAGPDAAANLASLRANVIDGMALAWEYRFFERELVALLRADPLLRDSYQAVYRRRLEQWLEFGRRLVEQGAIRPPSPPRTIRDLATAIWLIAGNWLSFLEITGDPSDPAQVAKGAELLLAVLDPYLTDRDNPERETP
jgi:AcrR family transcriptional regulator